MSDDNIISLNEKRNEREQPDPEFMRRDQFGRPMYAFGVSYDMDGGEWSMHVWAYSFEDAEARVKAIRESGKVFGQIMTAIPG